MKKKVRLQIRALRELSKMVTFGPNSAKLLFFELFGYQREINEKRS